jgi:hypothetical protein
MAARRLVSALRESFVTTNAVWSAGDAEGGASRPRGLVDRLLALPLRLPGIAVIWWGAVFVLMTVVPASLLWATGAQPVGVVDSRLWVAALLAAYGVALKNVLEGTARRAFREFMPALGAEHDLVELESALVSVPDRLAIPAVAAVELIITIGYFSDPNETAHILSRPLVEQAVILVTNWLSIAITGVLLISILRQLWAVSALHRLAVVDVFDPGPAHAFARLTSATAIGIVLYTALVLADPAAASDTILFAAQAGALLLVAAAAFGLPLRGMHARLAAEKATLLRAVNGRIKVTSGRVHAAVDADERPAGAGLHDTFASLIAERELIGKLSTWPWSAGTIRGVASALIVPIVVWMITRVLDRYL